MFIIKIKMEVIMRERERLELIIIDRLDFIFRDRIEFTIR